MSPSISPARNPIRHPNNDVNLERRIPTARLRAFFKTLEPSRAIPNWPRLRPRAVVAHPAPPPQCTIAEAAPHHELTLVHSVPPNVPLALA